MNNTDNIIIIVFIVFIVFIYSYRICDSCIYFDNYEERNVFDIDKTEIYYINLDRSKFRRKEFEKQARKHNLKVKRIEAIDAKNIDIDDPMYNRYLFNKNSNVRASQSRDMRSHFKSKKSSMGHFGCYLSQLRAIKEFLKTDKEFLIVCEDDARFVDNFKQQLIERTKNIPNDWDIILLGFIMLPHQWPAMHKHNLGKRLNCMDTPPPAVINKCKDGYMEVKSWCGGYGLVYTRKAAELVLRELIPMDWYFDWNLGFLAIDNKIKVYGLVPPIIVTPGDWKIENDMVKYEYSYAYDNNWVTTTNV